MQKLIKTIELNTVKGFNDAEKYHNKEGYKLEYINNYNTVKVYKLCKNTK